MWRRKYIINILISCPGRKLGTVKILREEFAKAGFGVIATGNSNTIPALYEADKAYIVPSVDDSDYIPCLLEICRKDNVKAMLSLLDKDVMSVAQASPLFREIGVVPLIVDFSVAQTCDNKYAMYEFLVTNGFKCARTYHTWRGFEFAYNNNEIKFPVFIKPVVGDGSRGAMKCQDMKQLELYLSVNPRSIIQEFMDGPEYDVDVYVDLISHRMVSIFAKEKLTAGIGGAFNAVSLKDEKIFALTDQLVRSLGATGPIDIDLFKIDGEYYVGEVNPRLGANYIWAYSCGVDFAKLIINNINGVANTAEIGNYEADILMMKHDAVLILHKNSVLSKQAINSVSGTIEDDSL